MERANLLSAGNDTVPLGPASAGSGPSIPALTVADLRERFLDGSRGAERGGGRGDHDLNPGIIPLQELRAAAVLVPLVDRAEGLTVLLTQRTEHLSSHAGQIAFPGGQVEAADADSVATALRETEEEIGLARRHVEPLGSLDPYVTRTGFMVTPIVGIVHPPFDLTIDPNEVAEAFEVPLDFILDPGNREKRAIEFQGVARHFYVYPWRGRNIWGATAGMLSNLAERLAG